MMIDIEMGSGNVYADLGLDDAEAMHVKARLTATIAEILDQRQLSLPEASATLGMSQAELAGLLRGEFRDLTDDKLIGMLGPRTRCGDCHSHGPTASGAGSHLGDLRVTWRRGVIHCTDAQSQ